MKRNLARILVLVLIISLFVPATASADDNEYTVKLTLVGDGADGANTKVEESFTHQAGSLKALIATIVTKVTADLADENSNLMKAFSGKNQRSNLIDLMTTANTGADAAWESWLERAQVSEDAKAKLSNRDNSLDDIAALGTINATFAGYTLTVTLTKENNSYQNIDTDTGNSSTTSEETPVVVDVPVDVQPDVVIQENGTIVETVTDVTTEKDAAGRDVTTTTEVQTSTANDGSTSVSSTVTKETVDANGNGQHESKTTVTDKDVEGNVTGSTVTNTTGDIKTSSDGVKTTETKTEIRTLDENNRTVNTTDKTSTTTETTKEDGTKETVTKSTETTRTGGVFTSEFKESTTTKEEKVDESGAAKVTEKVETVTKDRADGNVLATVTKETTTTATEAEDGSKTTKTDIKATETVKNDAGETEKKETTSTGTVTTDAKGDVTFESTTDEVKSNAAGAATETTTTVVTGTIKTNEDGDKTTDKTTTTTKKDEATGKTETNVLNETKKEMANGTVGLTQSDGEGNTNLAISTVGEDAVKKAVEDNTPVDAGVKVNPQSNSNQGATVQVSLLDSLLQELYMLRELVNKLFVHIETTIRSYGVVGYQTNPDGSRGALIKKSRMGSVIVPVEESCELVIADNSKTFTDVVEGAWYSDYVTYVTAREIFNGNGDGTFTPEGLMNRAMVAQMLYNLEEGAPNGNNIFSDVAPTAWYNDACSWAADKGLIKGYDGAYHPLDAVTRQDLVTILYRYAQAFGYDLTIEEGVSLANYTDGSEVATYAEQAMCWAISKGLIEGYGDGTLRPLNTAKRSEVAAVMQRLIENVAW